MVRRLISKHEYRSPMARGPLVLLKWGHETLTALVTGGNRASGTSLPQLAKLGMTVVRRARREEGGKPRSFWERTFEALDVSSDKSVADCAPALKKRKLEMTS